MLSNHVKTSSLLLEMMHLVLQESAMNKMSKDLSAEGDFGKKKHLRAIQIIYIQIKMFISSGMLTWVSKWSLIGLEWSWHLWLWKFCTEILKDSLLISVQENASMGKGPGQAKYGRAFAVKPDINGLLDISRYLIVKMLHFTKVFNQKQIFL